MSEDRQFTQPERSGFRPQPCPTCASHDITLHWKKTAALLADGLDRWTLATAECNSCSRRARK